MFYAKDFKRAARGKIDGRREGFVLTTLLFLLLTGACSTIDSFYIGGLYVASGFGSIAYLIIGGALSYGYENICLNVVRGSEKVKVEDLFEGFKHFGKAFGVHIINGVLIFLWSLLLIVPGVIKSLSYSMSYFILIDNPELSSNEARKKSMSLMQGNKRRLFCLLLSFIGWDLLCLLTLGVLSLWITPYKRTAVAVFYENIKPLEEFTA